MTTLREHAERYLAMRRALGFKLATWGPKLMSFIAYLESLEHTIVTTDDAVALATSTPRGSSDSVHWARRLDVVRIFARYLKALDPATEIPPDDVLSRRYRRITPYLYSPNEIVALLLAARKAFPAAARSDLADCLGPAGDDGHAILNDHSKPAGGSRLRDFARKPL
jgi:integrase/recombinase XerD